MVNLAILEYSDETYYPEHGEGCLSVYGPTRARVKRHRAVTAEYYDLDGNKHLKELTGLAAHIVQHEYDHLTGLTFLDRIFAELDQLQRHSVKSIAESVLASWDKDRQQPPVLQPIGLSFDRDGTGTLLIDETILRSSLEKSDIAVCQGIIELLNA